MNNVMGDDQPAYPVVELAADSRTFAIGDNPPSAPGPSQNPIGCAGITLALPISTSCNMKMRSGLFKSRRAASGL